jgi:hypothetical protein
MSLIALSFIMFLILHLASELMKRNRIQDIVKLRRGQLDLIAISDTALEKVHAA